MNKRAIQVLASVAMLLIAGLVTAWAFHHPTPPGRAPETRYYMDLKTSQLFVAARELPPIDAPSGGKGALAFVFSCGTCEAEKDRFVGFLESTDPAQIEPERRELLAGHLFGPGSPTMQSGGVFKGVIIAAPNAMDKWIARDTPEGGQIVSDAMARCAPGRPGRCWPPTQ